MVLRQCFEILRENQAQGSSKVGRSFPWSIFNSIPLRSDGSLP